MLHISTNEAVHINLQIKESSFFVRHKRVLLYCDVSMYANACLST